MAVNQTELKARFTIKFTNLMKRWNTRQLDLDTTTGVLITVNGTKYRVVKVTP